MSTCRKCSMLTLAIHAWRRRAEERQETIDRQAAEIERQKLGFNWLRESFNALSKELTEKDGCDRFIIRDFDHWIERCKETVKELEKLINDELSETEPPGHVAEKAGE